MQLTSEGLQLLLDWEVGGGEKDYSKFCVHPTVPGGKDTTSGITIGIGWDVGQHPTADLMQEWQEFLSVEALAKLATMVGVKGDAAKRFLPQMQEVSIPWEIALAQFRRYTVPRYFKMAQVAFPGVEEAPQCVQEALLSVVFNRGSSVYGPSRIEMMNIRKDVAGGKWAAIPAELRAMKRLWPDTKSLQERREAEAVYIEKGLGQSIHHEGHEDQEEKS
ncbi:MAG TPA: hypothetical protein HPP57_07630 [Deltaproteobacteria bacterium]|jgi:hypothetical protein|nr:hypothetical protein [Deltaproteobacteria bacterium]